VSDFFDLVQSYSPVLFRAPLLGHYNALDTYARATTVAGTAIWNRQRKNGFGFSPQTTGRLAVADTGAAPELNVSPGTLMAFGSNFRTVVGSDQQLISKRDAGGIGYEFYISGASLIVASGATNTTLAVAFANVLSLACRMVSGQVASFFSNGSPLVGEAGVLTLSGDDADLTLANLYTGARPLLSPLECAIIFPSDLLDAQIAAIHDAWVKVTSCFSRKRRVLCPVRHTTRLFPTAPLMHISGQQSLAGIVPDISGNGRNVAFSGVVTQSRRVEGSWQIANGVGDPLLQSAVDGVLSPDDVTLLVEYIVRTANGTIYSTDDGGVTRDRLYLGAANTWYYEVTYADGVAQWTFPAGPYNMQNFLTLRHHRVNPAAPPVVELNGETQVVTVLTARAGALVALAAPRVNLLNEASLASDLDGGIHQFALWNSLRLDSEVRKLYLAVAFREERLSPENSKPLGTAPLTYPVTLAGVAAAGYAGPWSRLAGGTLAFATYSNRAFVEGLVAASTDAALLSTYAYGAWYFRIRKGTDAGYSTLQFISSTYTSPTDASQNGYAVRINSSEAIFLARITGGVGTVIITSADGAVTFTDEYEVFVTRTRNTGLFVLWIRGGAYATWTAIGTGANNLYTTATTSTILLRASGRIGTYIFFPMGDTLAPTDIPELVDA